MFGNIRTIARVPTSTHASRRSLTRTVIRTQPSRPQHQLHARSLRHLPTMPSKTVTRHIGHPMHCITKLLQLLRSGTQKD
jgi:hypothetical protein